MSTYENQRNFLDISYMQQPTCLSCPV